MHGAPLWARAATVAAGPIFNFALSILVFGVVILSSGVARDPLTVGELTPLPVSERGLQPGDELVAINGSPVPSTDDTEAYAAHVAGWLDGGASLVGGCCGIGPAHITRLRQLIEMRTAG